MFTVIGLIVFVGYKPHICVIDDRQRDEQTDIAIA